ncbi:MAG: YbgC/FadM family acyl-CoA thioesterase [Leptothrix sp. (in: b-proteobacteria)]
MNAASAATTATATATGAVNDPPRRADFRLLHRLRVRWAEVDPQGIVFNGHYLQYVDTAMAGYWRALALPYPAALAELGGDLFVRHAALDYRASAHHDDLLEVGVRCERIGGRSMTYRCAVFRAEQCLVAVELVYVHAVSDADGRRRSTPVPVALRELALGFEAGEAMLVTRTGGWAELGERAQAIRTEVFVREQQIPAALEWDAADASCTHALASNRLSRALATGRLLPTQADMASGLRTGRIGRMAVTAAMRGSGVGQAVLEALLQAARARGDQQALLHAQQSAVGFYLRAGFRPQGPAFVEAGIVHQELVLTL